MSLICNQLFKSKLPVSNWPMFAFSRDLGTISSSQESVVWAIGLVRDPSINYMSQERHPYFWTKYNYINDAVRSFVVCISTLLLMALNVDYGVHV